MTSQLNVDTIVDKVGTGGTNITVGNDATYISDGGTKSQNLVQGVAKCWAHMTLGTTAIEDSFNCSSVSDDATGRFTITRTNNMDNADYSVAGACMADRVGLVGANADDTFTASQTKFSITDSRYASYQDYSRSCFQICGDLA